MRKTPAIVPARELPESVKAMLAFAAAHASDPVLPREGTLSAFDHPYKNSGGAIANSSDRVTLCPVDKPCRVCQARAKLAGQA